MDITEHCTLESGSVRFDQAGASAFAKGVAGDFNPIHDPGSSRFCVPGDLLFSVMLDRYGVRAETAVRFAGMLDADVSLALPIAPEGSAADSGGGGPATGGRAGARPDDVSVHLADPRGREILSFFGSGQRFADPDFVARLSLEYVRFSGRTFPQILVPLMRRAEAMINPTRPLVIYKDMALRLERHSGGDLRLEPAGAELSTTGKKGVARLRFTIEDDDGRVGEGEKNLVLSGLRAFDEAAMDGIVAAYEARRHAYEAGPATGGEAGGASEDGTVREAGDGAGADGAAAVRATREAPAG